MTTEQEVELLELHSKNIVGLAANVHGLVELSTLYQEQFRRLWFAITALTATLLGLTIWVVVR